jgi:hypothetical protein
MVVDAEAVTSRHAPEVTTAMAQLFEDEQKNPDNAVRANFVFLAYPFAPPIAQADYNAVVKLAFRRFSGRQAARFAQFFRVFTISRN